MSLTERIYGKETAGKPAVSSDTQKNLYTAAANKKPSLANRIAQTGGQPTLYADAAAKQKPSLASRIEANGGTPYADAAAQMKSGNAAKGTSVVFNSVYGKADDRASSAGFGKYAGILKASDYTELSKSGESKRKLFGDARYDYINNIGNFRAQSDVQQAQGRGQDYGKYAFMTDDEIGVYNYLYATQGKKAANAYLSDLEPELDKQWYTGTNRATTEGLGKNAATRTLASAMTVAAQPARTITSMIAMADDAVRTAKGQAINPYSKWRQASNITQDLRADTSQHIEETNPGMGGKVGSFVYNTAMSAADSAMNALVAKGIGEAVGLTGDTLMKATNILGSALMSSEAASLSIAESKEKGYSNAGALALGLTRGAIEYASEAVGGEWVIRKIKANPLSFVKSMALTMIPEGMEEVMSDAANGVVNLAIDAAFGTEESGIPKMLEYYRTSGTDWQKKHAELATVLAVLGQEGLSFLGGALATLGSSSVQYSTNRANINQTAERLDTTPKNVVQMMQDAQTENPGVIYALAELTDAENADDLRRKIGTKEDMKRAAEYLTQQMGASGRSGAQEGTYIAGTQNAPVGAQRAQNEGISTTPTAAINIQEKMNNEQSAYQGRENGSYDLRTGGQAAAEGGAQALAGGRAEIPGGVGADAQADLRKVTPAQLGIRNGGTEAVTVVDAQKLGGDAARAYNLLAANNIEPVAVRGAIQVNNGYANAYTESGKVFFRVDAVDSRGNAISPEALVRHELFHNYISEEVLQASDEVIRESMTAEEYDAMYESYRDAYASIYDFENMSEDEIERLLTEEIAADAYAGLNWFSGDAPVQEAVRAETERNAPARRAEAQQETTGPPEGQGAVYIEKSKSALESNPNSNAYVLASSIPLLQNSEVVKHLTGEELNDASKPLDQQISDLFASVGNVAHREGFGKVELNRYGVDGIINHKPNRSKVLGVAAIKEVIEKGYIIKTNLNWKGRGYDSYMIAAPVGLGDATVYVAAVVNRDQGTNKFYLDEVVDQDGNYINIKNEAPGNTKTGVTVQDGVTRGPKASSDAIIHSDAGDSQEKSSGKASVEVENRDSNNEKAAFDAETAKEFIRSYTSLRRVVEERTKAYQNAIKADDPNYDYTTESKWISKAEQELRAGEAQFKEAQRVDRQARTEKKRPRSVKSTKRDIMQLFSTDRANRTDVERVLNRNIGEMMAQGEIRGDALDTLVNELLQTGSVVSSSKNSPWIDETYESIRSDLKGSKLYVSKDMWRDFSKDEARELRERARAAGITLSDNRRYTPPDVRNIELAEKYGEALFPTDISAPDMLRNIVDRAAKGVSEKQTLADRLWDEARLEGAGRDQQEAYDRMVGALRDQTEVILREFAEDNHLTLREQTKQGSGNETGTKYETEQRRERLQALAEQDRREAERLRARENLGAGQRFVPNKSSGEVYRELMGKGKSEVKVQMTGFLKGTPKESTFKVEVKPTPIGGYYEATVFHDGHKADTLVRALKETAARDAAEKVITMANKNFSEENYQRAKKFEAEKTADEDARIAELFGDPEQLDSTEPSPKSSDAAETENTAAGTTIAATTEKVTSEVIKAERNYREDFEKITSGAMRMFVNAGDTVRRIAKATGSKSLEGYYFNAGAYSQRAGN